MPQMPLNRIENGNAIIGADLPQGSVRIGSKNDLIPH
jgi:hypothetical protein